MSLQCHFPPPPDASPALSFVSPLFHMTRFWRCFTQNYLQPFALPMGILGLSQGVLRGYWGEVSLVLGGFLAWLGGGLYLVLLLRLFWGFMKQRQRLVQQLTQPPILPFVGALALSTFLFIGHIIALAPHSLWTLVLWLLASVLLQMYFIKLIGYWIFTQNAQGKFLAPSWFVVFSAQFVAVVTGGEILPHDYQAWLWLIFAPALAFWWIILLMLTHRLIFHYQRGDDFRPTLFIYLGPPSTATLAWVQIHGGFDSLAWVMLGFATFMFGLWLLKIKEWLGLSFGWDMWAYLFPLAAYANALGVFATWQGSTGVQILTQGVLLMGLVVFGYLSYQSWRFSRSWEVALPSSCEK